ncbi:basic proline-rich protein-like [Mugil cephalus]|uniref:basic proline-rich protein-like n=1 Tax=Mugil cephalus TaxID=48193 RepID=UPI001FB6E5E4|nr:basic proline-rich protein-like [Mugil cephalus]
MARADACHSGSFNHIVVWKQNREDEARHVSRPPHHQGVGTAGGTATSVVNQSPRIARNQTQSSLSPNPVSTDEYQIPEVRQTGSAPPGVAYQAPKGLGEPERAVASTVPPEPQTPRNPSQDPQAPRVPTKDPGEPGFGERAPPGGTPPPGGVPPLSRAPPFRKAPSLQAAGPPRGPPVKSQEGSKVGVRGRKKPHTMKSPAEAMGPIGTARDPWPPWANPKTTVAMPQPGSVPVTEDRDQGLHRWNPSIGPHPPHCEKGSFRAGNRSLGFQKPTPGPAGG